MNSKNSTGLSEPFGYFSPTLAQLILIALTRRNRFARAAVRTRVNRLLQWLRPGPIDSVLFGWSFRFFPHENTGDRKALLSSNAFDPVEIALISHHLPVNGCFLDIGANIGVYSFGILSKRPDARIFAFEPSPKVFAKLAFNLALNTLEGKITALPLALSDKTGDAEFNPEHESLKLKGKSAIVVKTDTLLNVIRSHQIHSIDALKIDVEGAEDAILYPFYRDAPRQLWPKLLLIEHIMPDQWDWNCIEFLERNGYRQVWIGKMNTLYLLS